MVILIQQFFFPKNKNRQIEIMKCLNRNTSNENIHKMIHLNEEKYKVGHKKLEQVIIKKRLSFNDAVLYANEHLQGETVIVSNADIYFDDTIKNIEKLNLDEKTIVCNLRWERNGKLFMKNNEPRSDSQDFWVFKAPLQIQFPYEITLGKPGCDKAIVALCQSQGYNTINVPYLIKGHHVQSAINKYTQDMNLPRKMLAPSKTKVFIEESFSQEERDKIISGFEKNTFMVVGIDNNPHIVYLPDVVDNGNSNDEETVELEETNQEKTKVFINPEVVNEECVAENQIEETEEDKEVVDEPTEEEQPTINDDREKQEEEAREKAEYLDSIIDRIVNDVKEI